ncbi:MAG: hypothetical protein ACR2KV_15030, partial [Solirubrobacteraceae bacterium]
MSEPGEGPLPWRGRLGAVPAGEGESAFRVWAPHAAAVSVASGGSEFSLTDARLGVFSGRAPVAAGADYWLMLDPVGGGGEGGRRGGAETQTERDGQYRRYRA